MEAQKFLNLFPGSKKHPYGYYWRYCDSQGNILDNGYGNKKE
nr:MAG TPA: protein of unknown function (DUF1508) [Crassvirales sp.]